MKLRLLLLLGIVAAAANAVRLAVRALGVTDAFVANAAAPSQSSNSASATPAAADAWQALRSDDLATFTANLRSADFPDHVVRALIAAEIDERFHVREVALRLATKTPWQPDLTGEPLATRLARLDLKREKARLRQQLLGPDPASAEDATRPVAPEKREQLRMLLEDFATLIAEARSRAGSSALASEKKEIEYLEAERKRELAALLTPQELADIEFTRGAVVVDLRAQLRYFEPTDDEFRVIATIAKERRDASQASQAAATTTLLPTADARQKTEETRLRQEADLKAVLGEQRYAEFQRGSDPDYRLLRDLNARAQLPPDSAALAFEVRVATLAAATKLADDRDMAVDAKKAAVAQLVDQTRGQLRSLLGPDVGGTFLRGAENSGSWLSQLSSGVVVTMRDGSPVVFRAIYPRSPPPGPKQ